AVLGVIGLMMCSDPLRKLGLASLVLAAAQAAIVPRPHVAFTAVPAIYLGLGRLLTAPSLGLSKPAGRVVPNQMRRQAWAHNAVRAVALGAIMWLTNQDLVGDYSFVWTYWGQYAR
ncbi:MAG TPA: hypothetical protein VFN74_13445, partial [Chloroflexota bacterium]|nr:hypothetical protein [Chloroflexota bacterium]